MRNPLDQLREKYPTLPSEYFTFLQKNGGAEGELAIEPGWFIIWTAEEALTFSEEYELPIYLPGYFAFGGNARGELFVVSLAGNEPVVFIVPAIGMSPRTLLKVTDNFREFEQAMRQPT